jgi:hypothetical protein
MVWGLAGLALLAGCVETGGPPVTSGLRLVNAITDGSRQPVHIRLDGGSVGQSIPFLGTSQVAGGGIYVRVTPGEHNFTLRWATDTSVIVASYTFEVEPFEERTVYAIGSGGFTPIHTSDANGPPPAGTVRLKAVNLSVIAGPMDVFVTAPDADLATAIPQAASIPFGGASEYFFISAGTYRVRFVPSGIAPADRAANVRLNIAPQTLSGGGRTFVAADAPGGLVVAGTVLVDQ